MSEMELLKRFSKNLREILKEEKMRQEDLAIEVGISRHMISRYVTGQSMPSFYTVVKIAETLGYSIDEFIY